MDREMRGRRIQPDVQGRMPPMHEGEFGCFGGVWWGYAPGAGLGSLEEHEVQEHEDGTITVNPSIVYDRPYLAIAGGEGRSWHGYLVRGEWKETRGS